MSAATNLAAQDATTATMNCVAPSPASPQNVGVAITFKAEVQNTAASAPNGPPNGTVQFTYVDASGTHNLGSPVSLTVGIRCSNGNASATRSTAQITTSTTPGPSFLPGGTTAVGFVYTPSDSTASGWASANASAAYTVNKHTPTIAKPTLSPTPSVIGQSVGFSVLVTGTAGAQLDGTVQFYDGTAFIGAASLPASTSGTSTATFNYPSLTQGVHASITATYVGNTFYNASAASTAANSHTVNQRAVTVNVSAPATAGVGVSTAVNVSVADNSVIPLGSRGGFTATGSLAGARSRHASSLLPSGAVLVSGGTNASSTVLNTSEVYSSGSFAAGPTLTVARTGHTQTLLQDGTVLVVGGSSDGSTALDTAAIYDPAAGGNFSSLGACGAPGSPRTNCLVTARMNHTATLLSNGKVLIAGGGVTSLEVYDPTAKTFTTVTGGLSNARSGATATLLSDNGTTAVILFVGGDGTTTAELYTYTLASNSGTSAFTTNNATSPRAFHTATLLPDGLVAIMGGEDGATVWNTIEFYNPSVQTFYAITGTLPAGIQGHTARLLGDGSVLLAGGAFSANNPATGSSGTGLYTPPYDPIGPSVAAAITAQDSNAVPVADGATNGTCDTLTPSSTGGGTGTLNCAGTFTPAAVGTNPHVVTATFATTGTHTTNNGTANVTVKNAIVLTAATDTRTYNGTTSSSQSPIQTDVSQLQGTDAISTLPGEFVQTFDSKNVGARTLSITTVVIRDSGGTGTDHTANYTLDLHTAAGTITTAAITVASFTSANKVYDRTTVAPNAGLGCSFSGVIGGDSVTCSPTGNGTFDAKDVSNTRTVTGTVSIAATGDGPNYTLGAAGTTVNSTAASTGAVVSITPVNLTVSGAVANNKVYDRLTTATVNFGSASLVTVIAPDVVTLDTSAYTASFTDKTVANNKPVTVSGVALGGADAGNYTVSQPTGLTANITAVNLTISGAVANNKVYDRLTTATVNFSGASLSGVIAGDTVTIDSSAYTASFADKLVANNKPVTVSGVALGGADGPNYTVTQPTGLTANITPVNLTITGAVANNKVYDRLTTATVNFGGASLSGVIAGDTVTIDSSAYTASFADRLVANNKAVTVSGVALAGGDAPNYTLTQPTGLTANITPLNLTVSGAVANNKVYDRLTTATVNFGGASLVTVIAGDTVNLDTSAYTASFATKTVANNKPVTVLGVALTGADAANYTVSQPAGLTANITPVNLTIGGAVANNKVYDRLTTATVNFGGASLSGVIAGDTVTIDSSAYTASFADKLVANNKPVTVSGVALGGADGPNYTVTQPTGLTANITPLNLTVSGAVANNKVYDRLTTATVNFGGASLVTVIAGDTVTLDTSAYTASFADKTVANNKPVTVLGVVLSGADAANYTVSQPTGLTANITPLSLTVSGAVANNRPYDTLTTATVNFGGASLVTVIAGDTVNLDTSAYTASFATKTVANNKPVTVLGVALSGADAANYTVSQPTGLTANITSVQITATLVASNKTYNGDNIELDAAMSCSFSGVLGSDSVTCTPTSGTFGGINVGTYTVTATATIGGADGANYTQGLPGSNTPAATVTAAGVSIVTKAVTATLTANNKPYDGTTTEPNAQMSCAFAVGDIIAADAGSVSCTPSSGSFASASAGTQQVTATMTIGGPQGTNYTFGAVGSTQPTIQGTATATISTLAVTATLTAADKVYDQTTAEPNSSMSCVFAAGSILAADAANVTCTPSAGTFDSAAVGARTVTATLTIGGSAGANYTFGAAGTNTPATAGTAPANITGKAITGNISASNKVYDSTTAATISTRTLVGVIAGDNVTYSGGTATFSDKNVGTGKTVSATGLSLTGAQAGNYTVNSTATTTANITAAPLAVTATASNKVYNGNTTATVVLADNRFTGDVLTATNTTATFSDKNVGNGKTVTVSGISISGTDAPNYTVNTTTTTTANITPAALTVTASNLSKVQGTLLTFAGTEFTQVGLQPGDTLLTVTLSSAGTAIGAAPGNYSIVVAQPFTGTMAPSNYSITLTNGTLAVGQAPSAIKLVATFTAANNGFGGTYSFKATVTSSTSGTPSGTVTLTDNGTAISGSPITLAGGTATLSGAILTQSTTPHVIVATYNGDANFKTSTVTIDVTSAVPPSPFNAGGTVSPTAAVTFAGVATTTGTLATGDLTCAVTSAVVAVDPLLLSCTATLDKTLNPGGAGTLTINIRTVAGTVAGMRPPVNPAGGSMRSLYLLSFGMPAFVFIGLAAPLATLRQKKTLRGKLVVWLGLLLVFALLLVSVGCGGGFSNPNNLGPVTIRAAVPGTYTAVVTYKDSGNNTQVLAVMPFTIN